MSPYSHSTTSHLRGDTRMATRTLTSCFMHLLLALLIMLDTTRGMGIGYQGLEENCILSFVVPKEKMKSSCELDEKVNRRINAMEMKVNIYKQQVAELQMQQEKQRRADAGRLEKLEQQVRDNSVNADMSFLIERRLALLEKEFEQLHEQMSTSSSSNMFPQASLKTTDMASDDNSLGSQYSFNALDRNPVTLPNLVKSMVQAEVNSMFDNFTKKFEAYVREQILLYNQIFQMLATRSETTLQNGRPGTASSDRTKQDRKDRQGSGGEAFLGEFENIKIQFADTGHEIAKHVSELLKNRTKSRDSTRDLSDKAKPSTKSPETMNPVEGGASSDLTGEDTPQIVAEILMPDNAEIVLEPDNLDSNETFSGDHGEINNTTPEKKKNSFDQSDNYLISTRIGHGAEKPKGNSTAPDNAHRDNSIYKDWRENMIMDEKNKEKEDVDDKLIKRIEELVQTQLANALTALLGEINKKTSTIEDKMQMQEERSQIISKDIGAHLKELDTEVESINIRADALSQGFQDSLVKLEKIKSLDITVTELKKNFSSFVSERSLDLSPIEFDEHVKKVKKLERLMDIYQQSLEHYRNETKHEYRDIKDSLELEATNMKTATKSLHDDVEKIVSTAMAMFNDSYVHKLRNIDDALRRHEENVVLMQVDISSIERIIDSKSSRADRELEEISNSLDHLSDRQRGVNKKYDRLERAHSELVELVNTTAKDVNDLKLEVKLSVLDEWLPLNFDFDSSRTDCFGEQYVKRTGYHNASYVGVVLCSHDRYKIFLSNSLESQFLNVGDGRGMGDDHCEFVGASRENRIRLSEFKGSYKAQGWLRSYWGEEPTASFLNSIKPSPHWYECGVRIP